MPVADVAAAVETMTPEEAIAEQIATYDAKKAACKTTVGLLLQAESSLPIAR